jgi:hypothetical protein
MDPALAPNRTKGSRIRKQVDASKHSGPTEAVRLALAGLPPREAEPARQGVTMAPPAPPAGGGSASVGGGSLR